MTCINNLSNKFQLTATQRENLIAQALSYAKQEIPIVGCSIYPEGGKLVKHPILKGGFCPDNLTTDSEKIRVMFTDEKILAIGTMPEECGFSVIDLDTHDGQSIEDILELLKEYGDIPDTLTIETISGGRHLYFKTNRQIIGGTRFFDSDLSIDLLPHNRKAGLILPDGLNYFILDNDAAYNNFKEYMADIPEWIYNHRKQSSEKIIKDNTIIPLILETVQSIRSALCFINANDRETWVNIGMALKSTGAGDQARGLWDEWSQKSEKYDPIDQTKTWESFNPRYDISISTLFYIAKINGWVSPERAIEKSESSGTEELFPLTHYSAVYEDHPPRQWLVDEMLISPGLYCFNGDAGTGKTFIMLDLAVCVAMGIPWLNRKTIQCPVIILDEESGESRLMERLKQTGEYHKATIDIPVYFTGGGFDINIKLHVEALKQRIKQVNAGLLLIDSFVRIIAGSDENASKEISIIMKTLQEIKRETGINILFLHHLTKLGANRGSTDIKAAVDFMAKISLKNGTMTISTKSPESGKSRDTEPIEMNVKINFDPDNYCIESTESGKCQKLSKTEKRIIDFLEKENKPATREMLIKGAGSNARNVLPKMIGKNLIFTLWGEEPFLYAITPEIDFQAILNNAKIRNQSMSELIKPDS